MADLGSCQLLRYEATIGLFPFRWACGQAFSNHDRLVWHRIRLGILPIGKDARADRRPGLSADCLDLLERVCHSSGTGQNNQRATLTKLVINEKFATWETDRDIVHAIVSKLKPCEEPDTNVTDLPSFQSRPASIQDYPCSSPCTLSFSSQAIRLRLSNDCCNKTLLVCRHSMELFQKPPENRSESMQVILSTVLFMHS